MVILKEFEERFVEAEQYYLDDNLKKDFKMLCDNLFKEFVIGDTLYVDPLFEIMVKICDDSRIIIGHYIEECLENFDGEIVSETRAVL